MIGTLLHKIFGTQDERRLKKLQPLVDKTSALEAEVSKLSDDGIKERASSIRKELVEALKKREVEIEALRELIFSAGTPPERNKHKKEVVRIKNEAMESRIPEVFALVREASKRTIGLRHFDVQLLGGLILHQGNISEMATGEGKTLVATLPASLNALAGERVHIVTVNDYLARRDSEWMGPIYKFLGLSMGVIQHDMTPSAKQISYACDIVYGTNNEFGFDYLRDNMVTSEEEMVQGHLGYAIVDEVDSILIDEARTPLIISGPVDETNDAYNAMRPVVEEVVKNQKRLVREYISKFKTLFKEGKENREEAGNYLYLVHKADPKNREFLDIIMKDREVKSLLDRAESLLEGKMMEAEKEKLVEELYYVYDEKSRDAVFSAKGLSLMKDKFSVEFMLEDLDAKMAELAGTDMPDEDRIKRETELTMMYDEKQKNVESIKQLLKAYILFDKDVDYVVNDNKIIIVDTFTGRMMPGRRFSDGIHEALEAKERVEVQRESQTLATITLQNYFRMYDKLSGMTGTAKTEEMEFEGIYLLPVVQIPTNKPLCRKNYPDRIYKTEKEKFDAIINAVAELNSKGAPVLVGTVSIEKSERLSQLLTKKGVKHNVLNAKYHEKEAHIVAQAGRFAGVTIATNMAGRGTDILLGGNPEAMANDEVEKLGIDDPEERVKAFEKYLAEYKEKTKEAHEKVIQAGGLHVVGTERHESRRIDNQLRGRSGRQGDPGASQFYLSLEDDLMRIFGSDRIKGIMDTLGMAEGEVIENPLVTGAIRTAQKRVEMQNFEIRKHLLKYDDIMNKQREVIYRRRRMILTQKSLKEEFIECLEVGLESILETWDKDPQPEEVSKNIRLKYVINVRPGEIEFQSARDVMNLILEEATKGYEMRVKILGAENMYNLERMVMLTTIDMNWKEYLRELDDLREGISWRAYAQKDPFVEFQHEAFGMFRELMMRIDEEIAERVMKMSAVEEKFKNPVFDITRGKMEHQAFVPMSMQTAGGGGDLSDGDDDGASGAQGGAYGHGMSHGAREEHIAQVRRDEPKVGRNDACPCGSGKKYKKCCGK
ncbi:MAG: preprotein translocase subunit SecA [Candidatus Omnitrophica bacterium]|nr:preprotein translocase subunit SecA [Candidatus Omnitrophota bacterium]